MASGPITSWQTEGEKVEAVSDFIFLGSKITAGGDCSYEIKRCLLLRRKVMKNLDSALKSRDITLSTKVRIVKAMVFLVVMHGCESQTIKKAECQRIDAFELWCWRRLLRLSWTPGRSNQLGLKEILYFSLSEALFSIYLIMLRFLLNLWAFQLKGISHFLCLSLLLFANTIFFSFLLQIKALWKPCIKKIYQIRAFFSITLIFKLRFICCFLTYNAIVHFVNYHIV